MDVADFDPGGGGYEVVGSLLQGVSPGSVSVWGRDVGPDPQDGAGPEYLSAQGRATSHREAAEEVVGWELVLSSAGGGNCGSGLQ